MRQSIYAIVMLLLFVGCQRTSDEELYTQAGRGAKFFASLNENDTRTYINEDIKLRWHAEDQITLFVGSTLNKQYQFDGETGDNAGYFSDISTPAFGAGNAVDRHYAVYPYDSTIKLSEDGILTATFPAEQKYAKGTFGRGANMMVATTASTSDYDLMFRNVGSYLRVRLWGEDQNVKSITVTSRGEEAITGKVAITPLYNADPTCVLTGSEKAVNLVCDNTVDVNNNEDYPTDFWIVLPPVTLNSGFSVIVTNELGNTQSFVVDKAFTFERNKYYTLTRMLTIDNTPQIPLPPNNQIWYTTTDGKAITFHDASGFNATITSHTYSNGKGVVTFSDDVTTIGELAFYEYTTFTLKTVTLPASTRVIDDLAFCGCEKLESVIIPNGVTTIARGAFEGCSSLKELILPKSLETIESGAFRKCTGLTSIVIPEGVTTITGQAFANCTSLAEIKIPSTIEHFSGAAFSNCTSLECFRGVYAADNGRCLIKDNIFLAYAQATGNEYSIPEHITTIGEGAFCGCKLITKIDIPNSVTDIKAEAFEYCEQLASINIPDEVTTINRDAFYGCKALTDISIPVSISRIEENAFAACTKIKSVTIPEYVAFIANGAFQGCSNLEKVYCKGLIPASVPVEDSQSWTAFDNNNYKRKIYVPSSKLSTYKSATGWRKHSINIEAYDFEEQTVEDDPNIPNEICYTTTNGKIVTPYRNDFGANIISHTYENGRGVITFDKDVKYIGYSVFNNCTTLSSIVIPNSVTHIDKYVFYNCSKLSDITLSNRLKFIDERAFCNCTSITDITLPNSVGTINYGVFYNCTNLENINLSENLREIGEYAFYNCQALKSLNFTKNITLIKRFAFYKCSNLENITFADGSHLIEIGESAFEKCVNLKDFTIPLRTTTIGKYAFSGCNSLTHIDIPKNVTTIGGVAFKSCSNLESITLREGLTEIGFSAFEGCSKLKNVNIPDGIKTIDYGTFYDCSSLESVTLPNSITTINNSAFRNCSSLSTITIPESVTTIEGSVFYGCNKLKSFAGKFASADGRALIVSNCLIAFAPYGLSNYNIPNGVSNIDSYTFIECTNLKEITIPSSVTRIGTRAFYGCTGLTTITIPDYVVTIEDGTFSKCSNLSTIYCQPEIPPIINGSPFSDNAEGRIIYVPSQSISIYKDDSTWSQYASDMVGFTHESDANPILPTPASNEIWYSSSDGQIVTPNDPNAFNVSITSNNYMQMRNMGVITFSGKLTEIGEEAFKDCSNLTEISLPNDVKRIEEYAFANTGLTSFTTPESTYTIEAYAFYNCRKLTNVDLGNVIMVMDYAFKGCSLTELYIPKTLELTGITPFKCSTLMKFTGPTVKGDGKSLHLGYWLVQLADGACKNMTSYTVPNDVKTIYDEVFMDYTNLKTITIPEGVETIRTKAFYGCSGLKKVILPSSLSILYNYTFKNCSSLKSIYFNADKAPTENYNSGESWDLCSRNVVIRVAKGSLTSYTYEGAWQGYNVVEFEPGDYSHDDEPGGGGDDGGDDDGNLEDLNNGDVIVLQKASKGNGIDIVIMGDAYTQSQINSGKYRRDLETAIELLFDEEPYKSHREFFNIYEIVAVSESSSYGSGSTVFEGYFGGGTLVGGNHDTVAGYTSLAVPANRINEALIIVIMNRNYYAGTCYMFNPVIEADYGTGASISYFPLGTDDNMLGQIIRHEAGGHGFAKLFDEYSYIENGMIPASRLAEDKAQCEKWGWGKNVDFTDNENLVKWSRFLKDSRYKYEGLGVYQGGDTYPYGVWRPTYNSIMNDNTGGFNAPSREAIYYRIHKLAYGNSWAYSYETFVSWDAKNRSANAMAIKRAQTSTVAPTHPPIIVNRALVNAK